MLKKGYVATAEELSKHTSRGLRIDSISGMFPSVLKAHRERIREQGGTPHPTVRMVSLRPGLKDAFTFYGTGETDTTRVSVISDKHQSRYYCFSVCPRQNVILDFPSQSLEHAWSNLFRGLVAQEGKQVYDFYKAVADLLKEHFIQEGVPQSFTVEGKWRKKEDVFVASLDWHPEEPDHVTVSSTLDYLPSRKVSLSLHPIAEAHRLCTR